VGQFFNRTMGRSSNKRGSSGITTRGERPKEGDGFDKKYQHNEKKKKQVRPFYMPSFQRRTKDGGGRKKKRVEMGGGEGDRPESPRCNRAEGKRFRLTLPFRPSRQHQGEKNRVNSPEAKTQSGERAKKETGERGRHLLSTQKKTSRTTLEGGPSGDDRKNKYQHPSPQSSQSYLQRKGRARDVIKEARGRQKFGDESGKKCSGPSGGKEPKVGNMKT